MLGSIPDKAKRLANRIAMWQRARTADKLTLPIRWLIPGRIKTLARRVLQRPAAGLPAFLDYDLRAIARSLERRGFRCEVRDFPADYWSSEFRTSRSNLLIHVPRHTSIPQPPKPHPKPIPPQEPVPSPDPPPTNPVPQVPTARMAYGLRSRILNRLHLYQGG